MKLTEAQKRGLKAVDAGTVRLAYIGEISQNVLVGAPKKAIYALVGLGLVSEPVLTWLRRDDKFKLTAAGRAVLEELRKGKE